MFVHHRKFEKNEIEFVSTIESASVPLNADSEKLLHILLNLLSNAGKFTEKGKVELSVRHESDQLYMKVSDTGIGLADDQKEKIFGRFRQADSSTTRKFQGSGLGLSITRQFCEMMGGTIGVESTLGQGSAFTVLIPLPINEID